MPRSESALPGRCGRHSVPAIPELQPGAGDRSGAGLRATAAVASKIGYRGSRGPPGWAAAMRSPFKRYVEKPIEAERKKAAKR